MMLSLMFTQKHQVISSHLNLRQRQKSRSISTILHLYIRILTEMKP